MIMPDVNVVIGAMRQDNPRHSQLRAWLAAAVQSDEPLGLSTLVLVGVTRIITNPRVFAVPTPLDDVVAELNRLIRHPRTVVVNPGPRHWEIFRRLGQVTGFRGPALADIQHAAVAIEHDATWVSLDRDFARVPGLRWELP
ncbi:MAG: PIN domain-containing protein [Propionibacteriaceae bacterium]|jgi:toxin-antitoxin system PIN domain toxin|nr:PIN domain-containing protein [Propionibacteriaceae bacterium]